MIALCEIDHALEDGIKSFSPLWGEAAAQSQGLHVACGGQRR